MHKLFALAFLMVPGMASAQEGRIAFSRSVQYEFEIPERLPQEFRDQIPTTNVDEFLYFFNAGESVMLPAPVPEEELSQQDRRMQGFAMRMRMMSASRSDQEELIYSYVNFADGVMAETKDFLGRRFLISAERPAYAWALGSEQRQYLDYVVQKATAVHDGSEVEAWFTMQIPVQGGPGPYGGLPGMILLVTVDGGKTVYAASDVALDGLKGYEIGAPDEGEMVTPEEYEEMVVEKLEEIQIEMRSRGGNRRRPF
ncbi:MAG: GLPGLI family protein [Gemmatimonadota bacterium]|nr:GLPGLI family protein [Gemmatimonadota bacterium]